MKVRTINRIRETASSLVLVLVVTAAGALLVSGMLSWMNTKSRLTDRINQYDKAVGAASAATEKVIAHVARDFQIGGDTVVLNNLDTYRRLIPTGDEPLITMTTTTTTTSDGGLLGTGILGGSTTTTTTTLTKSGTPLWTDFEFTGTQGRANETAVDQIASWQYTNINSRFPGLSGHCATYRVAAGARALGSQYNTIAAVKQEVQIASIPVVAYQVFYGPDLEIHPGTTMTFSGRVHCNGTIYSQPAAPLTFAQPVTASRRILHQKHPQDPATRPTPVVRYPGGREAGVNSLSLAIGTNSTVAAARSILEIPPSSEPVTSLMGQQRLYNKADLIILVSNSVCVARSGAYNDFSITVPWTNFSEVVDVDAGRPFPGKGKAKGKVPKPFAVTNLYEGIVNTNLTFFDARENKTIRCTEIDIYQFNKKMSHLASILGRPVKTLYIADMRSQTSVTQSGIRIIFGQTLPTNGLTIATPNPLYVLGHYNAPEANLGTANTSGAVPAALIADAITVLSQEWDDRYSTSNLTWRVATNVTINAALLGGIVPSDGNYYSGGVENFPRMLENWSGYTFTFNGCMAALFHSAIAKSPWGARPGIYNPPAARNWGYDSKLSTKSGQPPSTPEVRTIIRRRPEVLPVST